MTVASSDVREALARYSVVDRLLAAVPLLAIVAWAALMYGIEAAAHPSPTLFVDELQWTQLSRSVAEHGVASIRGERVPFESLYVYLVAPVWWLKDTASSYELLKYLNIALMTSAAYPAYALARRLVSKPAALAVAAASIAIPPMVYALYVITEPLAYPWAVLCVWLIVEALAVRTKAWIAAAVIVSLLAPVVRGQLIVVPAAFALAAFALWWRSESARRMRKPSWTRADTVGLTLLAAGVLLIGARLVLQSNSVWRIAIDQSAHIGLHALWSAGAFTIGIGVLPVVAGVAGLVPGPRERLRPHDRPFIAVAVPLILLLAAYTGIKGAYNEVTFANRIDERNLFYAAPLLFLAAAIALERRRLRLVPLLAATGFVAYLIVSTELQLFYPYFDAPGFSIATMANRDFYWPPETIQRALLVTLAVSLAVALTVRFARGRAVGGLLAVVTLLVVGWNLTGQATAAGGANVGARRLADNLPQPLDWVDRATGGGRAAYLGQSITTGVGLRTNLLEFWNRSIVRVGTTDGTQLFPGPTFFPRVVRADGTVSNQPGTQYVLADSGVTPVGRVVAKRGVLRVYRLDGPLQLRDSVEGVDEETWMGANAAYNRFAGAGRGDVVVNLSRTGFCPARSVAPPAPRVTIRVGRLEIGPRNGELQPVLADLWSTRQQVVPNCKARQVRLPVEGAPFRVEVQVDRTFTPADFGSTDTRTLGVMVSFGVDRAQRAR